MAGHEPPAEPPSGYVYVDERRLETLEAAVQRLTQGGVASSSNHLTHRERLFNAFSRLERLDLVTTATDKKVDKVIGIVEAIANRFNVEVP